MAWRKRRRGGKRYRRGGKRRSRGGWRRRGRGHMQSSAIASLGSHGFPDTLRCQLNYKQRIYTAPAATFGFQLMRGNGLFDCDITGAGHQPMYFDQLAALYNHYRVYASKAVVKVFNCTSGSLSGPPTRVCLITQDDTINPTSMDTMVETTTAKVKYLDGLGAATSQCTLVQYGKSAKLLGFKDLKDKEDASALVTADPDEQWTYALCGESIDKTSNVTFFSYWDITYYCEFYERKETAQS